MSMSVRVSLMLPLLGLARILQATVTERFVLFGVKPDLVLLLVLGWTLIHGGRSGVVWAFLGGIWLDIFSGGPMGASSLALMAAVWVAGLGHRTLYRYNILVPLLAGILGTLAFALSYWGILYSLSVFDLIDGALPFGPTLENIVLPSVFYNATLMLCLLPLLNRLPDNPQTE